MWLRNLVPVPRETHFIAEERKLREAKLRVMLVRDGMGVCV